ncbi:MAG: DNA topoisomerase VI subunit B [Candidatus Diapherotrites archaeon]|nr:DNA topoisomerase VI subunit B [Candidatus Diapherotrites archaeon]
MAEEKADLFKEFKEHSVAEFFKKNRHMLGYSGKIRSLTTAVHELVTNSLDACEEAGILPDIYVKLEKLGEEHYRLTVRDNGPGIPPHIVPKVFGKLLAGTKFHRMIQTRGQQGIGAAGVTMFVQMTTGKPIHVKTSTGDGTIWEMDIMIDVIKNEPIVKNKTHYPGNWRGTEVIAEMKGVEYNRGKYSVYEYLRRTAIANPHVRITFEDPDGKVHTFERSSFEPVKIGIEAKPHPFGITPDDLLTISRMSRAKTVGRMLSNALHGTGGKAIIGLMNILPNVMKKEPGQLSWSEAEKIVAAFQAIRYLSENKVARKIVEEKKEELNEEERLAFNTLKKYAKVIVGREPTQEEVYKIMRPLLGIRIRGPRTDVLVPIGAERIKKSLKSNLKPQFVAVVERKPKVYSGGIPFLVEVGVAVGGNIEGFELMRFANRVPLLFDSGGCAITEAVRSIDWKRYGFPDFFNSPVVVVVNLSSTHVPYTTAGKQAIADVPEVFNEIRQALMEVGRKLKEYANKVSAVKELLQKKKILEHYLPLVAKSLAELAGEDEKELESLLKKLLEERYKRINELLSKIEGEAA